MIPALQPCALQVTAQEDRKRRSQCIVDATYKSPSARATLLLDVAFESEIVGDLRRIEWKNAGVVFGFNFFKCVRQQFRFSLTCANGVAIAGESRAKSEVTLVLTAGLFSSKRKICKRTGTTVVVKKGLVHEKGSKDKMDGYPM
ncbi:MAG: hypothetical protein BGO25_01065 [Acidobacteriales bacterium 59-55]|nr:MAG: hypothetical protein BGO25_01065 [Acidobacteriales bacterium 59-55]